MKIARALIAFKAYDGSKPLSRTVMVGAIAVAAAIDSLTNQATPQAGPPRPER